MQKTTMTPLFLLGQSVPRMLSLLMPTPTPPEMAKDGGGITTRQDVAIHTQRENIQRRSSETRVSGQLTERSSHSRTAFIEGNQGLFRDSVSALDILCRSDLFRRWGSRPAGSRSLGGGWLVVERGYGVRPAAVVNAHAMRDTLCILSSTGQTNLRAQ